MNPADILAQLQAAVAAGEAVAVATIVETSRSVPRHAGSKMLVFGDGRAIGTIGGGEVEHRIIESARAAISTGAASLTTYELVDPAQGDAGICGGAMTVFVEPYLAKPKLVVVGCGHVGKAVIELGSWMGFDVIALDDRADLPPDNTARASRFVCGGVDDLLAATTIDSTTSIVVVSRNLGVDLATLPGLLGTSAGYIGMMGSQRRARTTLDRLADNGVASSELKRICAPIGVEIGAESPEEIAVSIMAEVVAHRRQESPLASTEPAPGR